MFKNLKVGDEVYLVVDKTFFDSQWFFCSKCDEWIDYEFLKKDIENE